MRTIPATDNVFPRWSWIYIAFNGHKKEEPVTFTAIPITKSHRLRGMQTAPFPILFYFIFGLISIKKM